MCSQVDGSCDVVAEAHTCVATALCPVCQGPHLPHHQLPLWAPRWVVRSHPPRPPHPTLPLRRAGKASETHQTKPNPQLRRATRAASVAVSLHRTSSVWQIALPPTQAGSAPPPPWPAGTCRLLVSPCAKGNTAREPQAVHQPPIARQWRTRSFVINVRPCDTRWAAPRAAAPRSAGRWPVVARASRPPAASLHPPTRAAATPASRRRRREARPKRLP